MKFVYHNTEELKQIIEKIRNGEMESYSIFDDRGRRVLYDPMTNTAKILPGVHDGDSETIAEQNNPFFKKDEEPEIMLESEDPESSEEDTSENEEVAEQADAEDVSPEEEVDSTEQEEDSDEEDFLEDKEETSESESEDNEEEDKTEPEDVSEESQNEDEFEDPVKEVDPVDTLKNALTEEYEKKIDELMREKDDLQKQIRDVVSENHDLWNQLQEFKETDKLISALQSKGYGVTIHALVKERN